MTYHRIVVPPDLDGERADRIVASVLDVSRAQSRAAFDDDLVTAAGVPVKPSHRPVAGDELDVTLVDRDVEIQPDPQVTFAIVHEDPHLVIVDKPIGVVVHPTSARSTGTLVHGLVHRYPEIVGVGQDGRWGIVHRLDRDTSGLLVVARTEEAHAALTGAIARREVSRDYLALARGAFDATTGTIEAPIGRDPRNPTRMRLARDGKPAVTHYRRLAHWDEVDLSLLAVSLDTGRTHQIRVHLAAIDRPIVGDPAYGVVGGPGDPGRPWLHARRLGLEHPVLGGTLDIEAPLPNDLVDSLAAIGDPSDGSLPIVDPEGGGTP